MTRRITVRSGSVPRKVVPPASAAAFDGSEIVAGTVTDTEHADGLDHDHDTPIATHAALPNAHHIAAEVSDWSPSYSNLTIGNGTVVARYIQVGKLVVCHFTFTLGSSSAIATAPVVSLPVSATSAYTSVSNVVGECVMSQASGATRLGMIRLNSSTTFGIRVKTASTTYVQHAGVSASVPFTWDTDDIIAFTAVYEAA